MAKSKKTLKQRVIEIFQRDPTANVADVAKALGVSNYNNFYSYRKEALGLSNTAPPSNFSNDPPYTPTAPTQKLLNVRGATHGSFASNARVATNLMAVLYSGDKAQSLTFEQAYALQNIAGKLARIVNGDPNFQDGWADIAGYATLALESLNREQVN